MQRLMLAGIALAAFVLAADVHAKEPILKRTAHRSRSRCNCGHCRLKRAGNPNSVSWLAKPSNTPRYWGYYVGGGAAFGGSPRMRHEGVWGWDYFGGIFNRRVSLNWWHGARRQGGRGAYKTDGPKVFHKE